MKVVAKIWFSSTRDRFEGLCDNSVDLHWSKNKGKLVETLQSFFDKKIDWTYDSDYELTLGKF